METYTTTNVSNLLTAAAYVRTETIINGNQAAQLDAMTGQIKDLSTKIEAVPAKIADLAAQGKEKAVAMWERMAARYRAQFADAVATLRAWLVDFKANRPNVQINLDEPEDPAPATNNTPSTMNAKETIANTPANLAKLHTLAVNGSPMFYIWLDAVDDAATTLVYLTESAARADIARLEADDKEAGVYEPDAYRIINAAPYFA